MFLAQTNVGVLHWLGSNKDAFGAVESFLKSAAIIVGGYWTYKLFVKHRDKYPRATLEHHVQVLDYSADEWQVRVALNIKNEGLVLLDIEDGHTWVQQIKPYASEVVAEFQERIADVEKAPYEVRWPLLDERLHKGDKGDLEIEPQEAHDLYMDFFVNKYYEQILIYTFLENSKKPGRHIGWTDSRITDLKSGETTDEVQGPGTDKPRPQTTKDKEIKKK